MHTRKQWYLLAYDIRDPKRLQRLHYYLRKHALPLQRSVFLIHRKPSELAHLLHNVRQRIHVQQDDVRLYPVTTPNSIWAAGTQAATLSSLYADAVAPGSRSGLPGLIKTLFGKVA